MATKRKSGPIASATRMITGVGEYIMSPFKKLGGKVDRELGRAIGHNPKGNMSNDEVSALVHADDSSFRSTARRFGFDVEGPSARGAFLVNDGSKAWLFSSMRAHGRTIVSSVWSPLNVSVMRRENPDGEGFDTETAAKKYARLLEHEGKKVKVEKRWGKGWDVVVANPSNGRSKRFTKTFDDRWDAQAFYQDHTATGSWATSPQELKMPKGGSKWVVMYTRGKVKSNPEDGAAEMFESFTGAPSETIDEYEESESYHSWLAKGGDLIGLKVRTLSGYDATLEFRNVVMGLNEAGTQIYPTSGDQKLDLAKLHMNDLAHKDSLIVGWVWGIAYRAAKEFDGFDEEMQYIHIFGDEKLHQKMRKDEDLWEDAKPPKEEAFESGELPMLRYSCLNKSISIEGGTYKIDKPWMETSPGIEG